jgi:hypothetical protein
MLELAARSIGGLCSRVLRFGGGQSLELASALGRARAHHRPPAAARCDRLTTGPRAGIWLQWSRRRRPAYWIRPGWIRLLSIAACSSASLTPGRSAK